MALKSWLRYIVFILVIIFILSFFNVIKLITDYLWFDVLGFTQIFIISLRTKILLFVGAALIFFIFSAINVWISSRNSKVIPFKIKLAIILLFSLFIGIGMSSQWFTLLQYLNQTPFNLKDPIFLKDISFYIFSLPFFLFIWGFAMFTVFLTAIFITVDYLSSYIVKAIRPATQPQVTVVRKTVNIAKPHMNKKKGSEKI